MRKLLVWSGLSLAAWSFVACGGAPKRAAAPEVEPGLPQPRRRPPPVARPAPPATAELATRAAFLEFPAWSGVVEGPLQPIYDEVYGALTSVASRKCEKIDERVLAVAKALAPVNALLGDRWRHLLDERFELKLLEADARVSLGEAGLEGVGTPGLLSWLVAQAVADASCDTSQPFRPAYWTLGAMHLATSGESLYQTAFAAFSLAWRRSSALNPWQAIKLGAAIYHPWLDFDPPEERDALGEVLVPPRRWPVAMAFPPSPRSYGPGSVEVIAAPGRLGLARTALLTDLGDLGGYNQLVDQGEIVALGIALRPTVAGEWLISETVVPVTIPSCMVVPWKRVPAPEIEAAKWEWLRLPGLLVSDRCKDKATLDLQILSSWSPTPTAVRLELHPVAEPLLAKELIVDADGIGQSEEGDASEGITAGRRIELRPVLRGAPGMRVSLTKAKAAIAFDEPLLGLSRFKPFPLRAEAGGDLRGLDDLDLAPSAPTTFQSILEHRSRATPLTAKSDRVWIALTYAAEPIARGAAEEPAAAAAKGQGKAGARGRAGTVAKPAEVAKLGDAKAEAEKAEKAGKAEESSTNEIGVAAKAEGTKIGAYEFVRYVPLKLSTKLLSAGRGAPDVK
jgi:hypothetical protein